MLLKQLFKNIKKNIKIEKYCFFFTKFMSVIYYKKRTNVFLLLVMNNKNKQKRKTKMDEIIQL